MKEIEDFLPENSFHRILPDHADFPEYNLIKLANDDEIKRVVLCSGKVYFDISEKREIIRKEILDRHLKRNTRERKSLNKRPMNIWRAREQRRTYKR